MVHFGAVGNNLKLGETIGITGVGAALADGLAPLEHPQTQKTIRFNGVGAASD
jgi:hypothetical protein